jgi:enamine deaminase RidA (YjgF/YER057c/UK114 family)
MKRVILCVPVLLFLSALSARADEARIEYLKPEGLLNVPSFSQVTTASEGKLVFVSGQVAWDAQGKPLFPGDLEAQTRKTYENLRIALGAAGATFDDVVKFTVYVKNLDTDKWRAISKVRSEFLSKERPAASTMIGVTSLVYDELLIEIDAIAVVDEDEEKDEGKDENEKRR